MILLLSIVAIGAIIYYHSSFQILSSNIVLAPVFGALIFKAAAAIGPLSRILSAPSLVLLGDASYATYIIHAPLWMIWYRIIAVILQVELPPLIDFFCYMSIVLESSIFTYLYIERPARRWVLLRAKKHLGLVAN